MIKNLCFSLWATLWVAFDKLGEMLGGMTLKEFAKFTGKVVLYGLSVIGWFVIIYSMFLVGWAIS